MLEHIMRTIVIGLAVFSGTAQTPTVARTDNANGWQQVKEKQMVKQRCVGIWVTDDSHVRHELLGNGRYDEARGNRLSAYQGRYQVTGTHIQYWDDTGFTADGDFVDENTLHHGGMILRRQ